MDLPLNERGGRVLDNNARHLHRNAIVIDGHADTPSEFFLQDGYDFGLRHEEGHLDLPRLREGGVDLQFLIAWVPAEKAALSGASFEHAMGLVEAIHRTIGATPGARLITNTDGLHQALSAGEIAFMIGVEGGHAIENSLEKLRELHARGARYLTLTWNNANDWADSSAEPARHGGLTCFGREVVRELNRLRMIVDVSHVARSTFYHVLEVSERPVIASHSCAHALARHHRNLDDQQLRDLANAGGVVGVNFFPAFLDTAHGDAFERIEAEALALQESLRRSSGDPEDAQVKARAWRNQQLTTLPPVAADTIIRHIDHMVQTAGIDHVALGSDFDGIATVPIDLPDIAALPRITELLLQQGYGEDDVRKVLGGNLLRILTTVVG
jgi:membrane dipeptidase